MVASYQISANNGRLQDMSYNLTLELTQIPGLFGNTEVKMIIATRGMGIIVFERIYDYSKFEDIFEDMNKVFENYDLDSEARLAILKEMVIEHARAKGGDDDAEEMRAYLQAGEDLFNSFERLGELLELHMNSDVPMDDTFAH